jgi:Zn-dependent protease
LSDFILALPMLVFAMVAHEYAHAITALHQGDDTAYLLGRVTLNPLPHIDPVMSIVMPAALWFLTSGHYTFGGAKPVPVNSRKFRNFRRGDIIVSAAGVTTNLFLSLAFSVLFVLVVLPARGLPRGTDAFDTTQPIMDNGNWLNLILCFFNLIPIPPLDGSHLLYHALPARAGAWYRGLNRFGFLPLFALIFLFRPVMGILLTPALKVMSLLWGLIAPYQVGPGAHIFSCLPPRPPPLPLAPAPASSSSSTPSPARSTCSCTSCGRSRSRSPRSPSPGSPTSSSW